MSCPFLLTLCRKSQSIPRMILTPSFTAMVTAF